MHRKLAIATLAAALLAGAATARAQDFVFSWNPRTGDVWIDQTLGDINDYGYRYRESFIDELVRYYDAPRDYVTGLLLNERWAPGDVYYACAIGEVIGRSCRYVADEWEQHHGEGWGALAQRLGIKPGSAEFHRLKQGFVPTYDHWARPLPLDDALHRAFPDRGHGNDRVQAPGNSGKARGNSGHAQGNNGQGNAGKTRGNSGQAHGNSGKAHGNSGNNGNQGKAKGKSKGKGHGKDR